jgi:hypothetical protein
VRRDGGEDTETMADNLLEMLKGQFTGPLLDRLASTVGIDSATARRLLESSTATMLSGLALKSQQPGGGEVITDMLKKGGFDGSLLDNLGNVLNSPQQTEEVSRQGGGLLEAIFGPQLSAILGLLSKVFGVGAGVIGKLLPILAPLVMSQLGKVVMGKGLGAQGLADLLKSQLPMLKGSLPPGLDGVLGLGNFGSVPTERVGVAVDRDRVVASRPVTQPAEGGFNKLLPWLALGALLLAGLLLLPRLMNRPAEPAADGVVDVAPVAPVATSDAPVVTDPGMPKPVEPPLGTDVSAVPAMTAIELPGGTKLDVPAGSVFEKLIAHLQTPNADLTKTFALDALAFAPDSTTPTSTIAGFDVTTVMGWLAKILQAFPNSQIKLVGVSEEGKALPLAEAVKAALVALGIGADRVTVEAAAPAPADAPKPTPHVEVGVTKL